MGRYRIVEITSLDCDKVMDYVDKLECITKRLKEKVKSFSEADKDYVDEEDEEEEMTKRHKRY